MAYSPPTASIGDVISKEFIDTLRIKPYRQELDTTLLNTTAFSNNIIETRNIAKPEYTTQGNNVYEWRGESGGLKYKKLKAGNIYIQACNILSSSFSANTKYPAPSTSPGNSGISTIISADGRTTVTSTRVPDIPHLGLTVRFDEPCMVVVRAKCILNHLSGTSGSINNAFNQTLTSQYFRLLREDPETASRTLNTIGYTSGNALPCQSEHQLRQVYLNNLISITTPGIYSFVVAGNLRPNGSGVYESIVALLGKAEMSIEWWHTSVD